MPCFHFLQTVFQNQHADCLDCVAVVGLGDAASPRRDIDSSRNGSHEPAIDSSARVGAGGAETLEQSTTSCTHEAPSTEGKSDVHARGSQDIVELRWDRVAVRCHASSNDHVCTLIPMIRSPSMQTDYLRFIQSCNAIEHNGDAVVIWKFKPNDSVNDAIPSTSTSTFFQNCGWKVTIVGGSVSCGIGCYKGLHHLACALQWMSLAKTMEQVVQQSRLLLAGRIVQASTFAGRYLSYLVDALRPSVCSWSSSVAGYSGVARFSNESLVNLGNPLVRGSFAIALGAGIGSLVVWRRCGVSCLDKFVITHLNTTATIKKREDQHKLEITRKESELAESKRCCVELRNRITEQQFENEKLLKTCTAMQQEYAAVLNKWLDEVATREDWEKKAQELENERADVAKKLEELRWAARIRWTQVVALPVLFGSAWYKLR